MSSAYKFKNHKKTLQRVQHGKQKFKRLFLPLKYALQIDKKAKKMITKLLAYFEKQAFGVCSWWGEKLQLKTSQVRLSFIYVSFLTVGSPIIIYLVMAFVLKHKEYFKLEKRKTVWDI